MSGSGNSVFAGIGEVLFWLYAIGDNSKGKRLSLGLQWARHQYAHGNLLTDEVEYNYGAMLGQFVLGKTRLGQLPQYVWMTRSDIIQTPNARILPRLERAYDRNVAGHPVIASLRLELSRLR